MIYQRTPTWMAIGYIFSVTLLIIGLIFIFSSGQETTGKMVIGLGVVIFVLIYWTRSLQRP
jgi:hypothetical protein